MVSHLYRKIQDKSLPEKKHETEEQKIKNRNVKKKEVLIDNYYYDVTDFVERHPGGRVIDYYTNTGEDATHAIQQFHYRSRNRVNAMMKSLKRRPALEFEGFDLETKKKRQILSEDFNKLYKELEEEGLFETSYTHNALRVIEMLCIGGLGYYLIPSENISLKIFGLFLASLAHGRSCWLEHEAGHRSFTGHPKLDQFFQSILFGVGVGLSARVWNTRHKRHHSMPNKLNYDIDLELMPVFVSDVRVVKDPEKEILWLAKYQMFLVPLTAALFVIGSQFYHHPRYIWKNRCYMDGFWMLVHYLWICQYGILPFLVINFLSLFYCQVILSLNHTTLPVHTTTFHWVEFAFLHTLNIHQNWHTDWWTGYVNTQIEHHLFPTMPHFNHKYITGRTKALAKKHNLPYYEYSFWGAFAKTVQFHYEVQKELQEMF